MRLLLVEDEVHLAEPLAQILKQNNYAVDTVYNGEDGLDYGLSGIYDGILLDIMLPKLDGLTVLRKLREQAVQTPVLLLTARGETDDKIKGLDTGADDYLAKPFSTGELLARIRAMTRRKGEIQSLDDTMSFADIKLDMGHLRLSSVRKEINLSGKEAKIMEYLIINHPNVCSKEQILDKVWGFDSEAEHNHVEVYISFLRKKLDYLGVSCKIATVRGIGYHLEESDV